MIVVMKKCDLFYHFSIVKRFKMHSIFLFVMGLYGTLKVFITI